MKLNEDMLNSCILFEKGGNYAQDENDWYRGQMNDITDILMKSKEEKEEALKEIH